MNNEYFLYFLAFFEPIILNFSIFNLQSSIFNLQSSIGNACVPAGLVRQRNECYRLSSVRCRLCVASGTHGLCAGSLPRTAAPSPRPTRLLPTRSPSLRQHYCTHTTPKSAANLLQIFGIHKIFFGK